MKVCTSPTFEDITKEMKDYGDVPFGVNSPTALARRRQWSISLIWVTFVVTSLPVHLFLNGVSGFSIETYPVSGRVTTNSSNIFDFEKSWKPGPIQIVDCAGYLARAENWVTEFNNLTIVVKSQAEISKYQGFIDSWNSGAQENQGPPSANDLVACYINEATPQCTVTLRWFPLLMTTLALVIKSITAFVAIRKNDHFKHRLYNTLGDFITLAARHRDELAVPGECLASNGDYRKPEVRALRSQTAGIPLRASNERRYWLLYLGPLDWTGWVFWIGSVILVWILMGKSVDTVRAEFRDENGAEIGNIFSLLSIAGFGKASLAFVLGNSIGQTAFNSQSTASLPLQIAIANSPQLWLSVGYLFWNNQITRIWAEQEWRSYAGRRKQPRVSYATTDKGMRNARWLTLPYGLSAGLMLISIIMHWVLSQALFVVEVENFSLLPQLNGKPAPFGIIYAICYSPTAIFVIALLSLILLFALSIYYLIPFRSWMPFMAGSARVVFASCTALPRMLPEDGVMWGDISDECLRLAGFGENAKGLQTGKVYPEKLRRNASPPTDSSPVRSFPPSVERNTSEDYDGSFDRAGTILSRRSTVDTIRTALPPYEPNPPPMPSRSQYSPPISFRSQTSPTRSPINDSPSFSHAPSSRTYASQSSSTKRRVQHDSPTTIEPESEVQWRGWGV